MLFIQLQLNLRWPPDMPSFIGGLLLGIALTVAFYYWLPTLRAGRDRAVGRVRQTLAWFRSGVEVRYQTETAEYLNHYHLGAQWGNLADIMTVPRLLAPPTDIDPHALNEWQASQLALVWPELAAKVALPPLPNGGLYSLLGNGRRVLVSGPAGSGKTSLLAYSAYVCATSDDQQLLPILPAYLHLAELDVAPSDPGAPADEEAKPADPLAPLLLALQSYTSPLTTPGLKDLLRRKLKAGQALLLVDGWDELSPEQRGFYLAWLTQLFAAYPEARLIMSVGLSGYGRLLDFNFVRTQLLPWRQGEVAEFAAGWATALNNNPLRPERYWRPGQTALQTSLRFWLVAHGGQKEASQKPYREADLLAQTLPLLCAQIATEPAGEGPFADLLPRFWQQIAHYALRQAQPLVGKEDLERLADETAVGHDVKDLAARLVKSVAQCPLFVPVKGRGVRFRSLVWRDYLAARHLARHHDLKTVQAQLDNPQWQHVITFYVAQAEVDATNIMQLANTLLQTKDKSPTRENLFQVAAWLPELVEARGEWQRQVLILLGQIVRQTSFPHLLRQRAAAALVQTGEKGVFTFVTQLLDRSDPFLRQMGVMGLSYLASQRPQEVIRRLGDCLDDGAAAVRLAAVQALAWLYHPLTEEPLLAALVNGDDEMSRAAAGGLALHGSDGLAILREALVDEAVPVRRAAVHGLLLWADSQAIPWLEKVERGDKEWLVRSAATEAIELIRLKKQMGWQPLDLSKLRWLVDYAAHDGRTVPAGGAGLPFLVQVLAEATDPDLRAAAAFTLSLLPAPDVIPALETAVRHDDDPVSQAAFSTLCTIRRAYEL